MLWGILKNLLLRPAVAAEPPLEDRIRAMIRERSLEAALECLQDPAQTAGVAEEMRLALLGEVHYHANDKAAAEDCFRAALQLRPSLPEGHYGLSLLHYDAGQAEDALAHAQYARNVRPDSAPILAQVGLCYIAVKDYSNARDALRQATLLDPDNVPALNNLGIALHATGDPAGALYYFQRALALKPDYGPALTNLRNLYGFEQPSLVFDATTGATETRLAAGQVAEKTGSAPADPGLADLERQFEQAPADEDLAQRLVQAHLRALQLEDARDTLHVGLAHHPDSPTLLNLAGRVAHMLGQYNQAKFNYERTLAVDPDNVEALLGLSQVLRDQGLVEDALGYVEQAAARDDGIPTLMQLAAAQANACRYRECLATCERIEARDPQLAPFLLTNRAVSHAYLGQFAAAMACIDAVERIEPANLGLRVFTGILHLLHERYAEGWAGYRYRFLMESNDQRLLPFPRWQGEDLAGKTILVLAEQGLGDQVMFASCLPDLLARRPAKVVLEAHARVAKTLARSFPAVEVIASGQNKHLDWYDPAQAPDCYVHIADLPYFFRRRKEDFPAHRGYLVADPQRVAHWRERLRAADARPKIGISWRGGLQKTRQRVRSLELKGLLPLLDQPDLCFVNLQYGEVTAEIEGFRAETGLTLLHYPEAIADLDEFAALIGALDLVITVCNTTVHYTGALGRPCWVLAPHIPEWRYGLAGEAMRWYPSVRMYRQSAADDWAGVLARVRADLAAWRPPRTRIEAGTKAASGPVVREDDVFTVPTKEIHP